MSISPIVSSLSPLSLTEYCLPDTDFNALDSTTKAWNVVRPRSSLLTLAHVADREPSQIRSEFDHILFKNASTNGASVHDGTKVTAIHFIPSDPTTSATDIGRPVAADYISKSGTAGTIKFNFLVDASGRSGVMSTKYLKDNRKINQSLRNVAVWGYWKDGAKYAPGTKRENAPWFESLTGMSSWFSDPSMVSHSLNDLLTIWSLLSYNYRSIWLELVHPSP